jgi:hypothetical protein
VPAKKQAAVFSSRSAAKVSRPSSSYKTRMLSVAPALQVSTYPHLEQQTDRQMYGHEMFQIRNGKYRTTVHNSNSPHRADEISGKLQAQR